jgi:hypothetical protein
MADLILEPYAVRQRWTASDPGLRWEVLIGDYLEAIARRCHEMGSCLVGHIKGLVLFADGEYLRISVVSPGRPAEVEGRVPAETMGFLLSLNVIVYGKDRDALERISRGEARHIIEKWKGGVKVEEVEGEMQATATAHHTSNHEK